MPVSVSIIVHVPNSILQMVDFYAAAATAGVGSSIRLPSSIDLLLDFEYASGCRYALTASSTFVDLALLKYSRA
jgi:hypothetical protein